MFAFQTETEEGIIEPVDGALGYKTEDSEKALVYVVYNYQNTYMDSSTKITTYSLPYTGSQKPFMFEIKYLGKRQFQGNNVPYFQLISISTNVPIYFGTQTYFYLNRISQPEFIENINSFIDMKSKGNYEECCKSMSTIGDKYSTCIFSGYYFSPDDSSYSPKCKAFMNDYCSSHLNDNKCLSFCNNGKNINCDLIAGDYCKDKSLTDKTCYCFWTENKMSEYYESLYSTFPNLQVSQQVECSHALCSRQDPYSIKRYRVKVNPASCPTIKLCVQSLSLDNAKINTQNLTINQKINCGLTEITQPAGSTPTSSDTNQPVENSISEISDESSSNIVNNEDILESLKQYKWYILIGYIIIMCLFICFIVIMKR